MSGVARKLLGRDTIGFAGGLHMMASSTLQVLRTDPSGTISIMVEKKFLNITPCTTSSWVRWRFTLSKRAKDLCPNHSGGFFVQKSSIQCAGEACSKDKKSDSKARSGHAEHWEVWYVGAMELTPSVPREYTDQSFIPPLANSCGSIEVSGELRFCYSDKNCQDAEKIPPVSVNTCGLTITSMERPGSTREFSIWTNSLGVVGVSKRTYSGVWNRCTNIPTATNEDFHKASPHSIAHN